jgi:hypothetical protein
MTEKIAPALAVVVKTLQLGLITCARCGARWTGLTTCHCGASGCHCTFTSLRAFDIHRTGGHCNDPATLRTRTGEPRLAPITRGHWSGWGEPKEDTRWAAETESA